MAFSISRMRWAAAALLSIVAAAPPPARVQPAPKAVKPAVPAAKPAPPQLPVAVQTAMQRITPNSLMGNVSFLASDALEGRNTPSKGLEVAAEFIAAQFRRAGLDPIPGTGSYFQVADWRYKQIPLDGMRLTFEMGEQRLSFDSRQVSVTSLDGKRIEGAAVYKVKLDHLEPLKDLADGALEGKIVMVESFGFNQLRKLSNDDRMQTMRRMSGLNDALRRLKPAAVLGVRRGSSVGAGAAIQLITSKGERKPAGFGPPIPYSIHSPELVSTWDGMPEGETAAKITLVIPEAAEHPVQLRNVIGLIPGSDPVLKDSYVLVTAHYDHVGTGPDENGDSIFNGANDDASGTASVIEIASAFASAKVRPKRTLVFMTVFGEEKGLLGTYHYVQNPVFPLEKTIANINLEHMGRTDDSEDGPQLNRATITGFDFSDVPAVFEQAGKLTGITYYKHDENSDAFFNRSDNVAFAEAGIPAHTMCVVFEFEDYHGLGDHWDKLDYENMAKVNRSVAAGVFLLANRNRPPEWNQANRKAEKYRNARHAESDGNKGNKAGQ